jgi:hypothetical protein
LAGKCVNDYKKLKGGVNCIDAKGNTCFCSKVGCKCGTYGPIDLGQGARNFNSQFEWCQQYDPNGANNQFCKDHMPIPDSAAVAAGKQVTSAVQNTFSVGNMTTIALIGIGVLAVFMIIS